MTSNDRRPLVGVTALVALAALGLAALVWAGDYDATVVVEQGERFTLAEAETVHGDLVVMGGAAYVLGRVEGNVVVVDGRATLGATARVDGDALTVRGELQAHDLAVVGGERRKLSAQEFARLMAADRGAQAAAEAEATPEQHEPEETEAEGETAEAETEEPGPPERTERKGDLTAFGSTITVPETELRVGSISSFGGPVTIDGAVRGDVMGMGGAVRVNGSVDGAVASLGGPVYVSGTVDGDIAVFGGSVSLADGSHVTGSVAVFGGSVDRAEGATLDGQTAAFSTGITDLLLSGVRKSSADHQPRRRDVTGAWISGNVSALLLTLLIALLFPNATRTVADNITARPGAAAAHGIVTLLLVGPVCVLLAITCIGLVGIPLVLALVGVADLLGIVAVNLIVGRKTAGALNWTVGSVLGLAVIGALVLRLVAVVSFAPLLGMAAGIVGLLVAIFGVGGAVMTRLGTDPTGSFIVRRIEPNGNSAPAVPPAGD